MLSFIKKPYNSNEILKILNPLVREWFFKNFKEFSLPQLYGVMEVHKGNNILITAPTGGTKTLTSTLSIINELVTLAENNVLEDKVYCLYLNPLKSLSYDIEINLQKPLKEIKEIASKQGKSIDIRIGVRTGDTTASEKSSMLRKPPHILILTPESLAILLSTIKFREFLRDVKYVIIDEIHALAENKRGVHLSLSLERLSNFVNNEYVRVGLSATIAPLDEIANFLVGDRDCLIADVRFDKKYDLKLLSPVEDLINVDYNDMHSSMYILIDNLIQGHKTTLIFTNTRSATERVVHYLKEKFPRKYMENIGAHHGSLSKILRHSIEKRMREGQLKVCVSSTSLELGLDIGFIDLVICLSSPKSIARLSQRCLPYDSKVLTSTGEYISVGKIVEERLPIKLISYDKNKGYVVNAIDKYHKNVDNGLMKIRLKCGEIISCTKDHPLLTKEGWKKTRDLTKKDKIAEINANIKFCLDAPYIYELLPKDKIYVVNKDNFYQKIIDEFRDKNNLNVKEFSETYNLLYSRIIDYRRLTGRRKSIRLDYFLEVCKITGKPFRAYKNYLKNLKTKNHFREELPLRLNKELMWLAGIVATDGCIVKYKNEKDLYYHIKIGNKSKTLIREAEKIMQSLGFRCHKYEKDDFIFLECGSNLLAYLLMSLGVKCKNKSRDVEVGEPIFRLNKELIYSYLEGVFEGDGNFNNRIRIFTASKKFAYGLHKLLRRCGYHNNITKSKSKVSKLIKKVNNMFIYCLSISRKKDIKNFFENSPKIGDKTIKCYNLTKKFALKLRQKFQQFDKYIYWSDISSIKKIKGKKRVYNLTLKGPSNFIVNNTIVHNCGRAGHKLHDTVRGRIIVLDRDDLIESAVMLKCAIERKIDRIHIPRNCLDVLAQQIIGIAVSDKVRIDNLYKMIKRSYCYNDLDKKDFLEVLDYLAGEYTTLEDRNVYAKIWKDNEFIGRRGKLTRMLYMTNIGTIPEESHILVKVGEQVIGTIDESFLERLKPGDVFVLGGETYLFRYSKGQTAQVSTSVDRPPTVPSWFSEMLPLSFDLSLEINKFRKYMEEKFKKNEGKEKIMEFIDEHLYVDKNAAEAIYNYFNEQYLFLKEIPSEKKLIIEHYKEDRGNKIVFHSLYGRRVNDCLSRALAYCIYRIQRKEVDIGINDNGFYIGGNDIQIKRALDLLIESDLRAILDKAIDNSEVLKRRFRHCACRALMILRMYKGKTKRVGRQQVSSMLLINAVKRISENFSILKEAKREVLEDLMDIENSKKILNDIKNKKIEIKEVHSKIPSPFAFNLVLQGYSDVLKMEDKIRFLRNMHNMILAKINLK